MRTYIISGIVVFALLVGTSAPAQDGFHLTSAAKATIGRDYGFLANDQKLTDTILVLQPPQLSFTNKSLRRNFDASYQPEIELFDNNHNLNAWNHTGSVNFTFKISARLRFKATDDILATQDPTRSVAGSLIFLPRHDFKQNMAHVALDYSVSPRNTVSFSFDNIAATAPLNTIAFPGSGRVRNGGTVSLAHAFKAKRTMTVTYSLLNAKAQFVGMSYEGEWTHDLTVHLSTGLLKDRTQSYLLAGQVEKRVGTVWLNGGYHRILSLFGSALPGGQPIGNDLVLPIAVSRTDVYQIFSAGISGKLSRRTGIELAAGATLNNSGIVNRDINNVSGRFKLDYSLTERLKAYTDLQIYSQTYNVFVGNPIDRRRYLAGIQFAISGPSRVSRHPEQTKPTQR